MARLQILELPEGSGDDRPPYILVIDQCEPQRYLLGPDDDQPEPVSQWDGVAEKIGARYVLVFEETVEIPANEVPVDPDGYPLKVHVEGDFEKFREQVQEEALYAQGKVTRVLRATDQDRKNSLTDALGMDRTRDWDDIRNAVAGIHRQRDAQAEALESIRNLPERPEAMDPQHPPSSDYLFGYRHAIDAAKRAARNEPTSTLRSADQDATPPASSEAQSMNEPSARRS